MPKKVSNQALKEQMDGNAAQTRIYARPSDNLSTQDLEEKLDEFVGNFNSKISSIDKEASWDHTDDGMYSLYSHVYFRHPTSGEINKRLVKQNGVMSPVDRVREIKNERTTKGNSYVYEYAKQFFESPF